MTHKARLAYVKTERFTMEYAVFGEGERPFVILPGLGLHSVLGSADAVAAVFESYAKIYRVYVIEWLRELPEGYSARDMARDTAETMMALGLHDADVFGASFGGMIAQVLAAEYPALVRRLVLAATLSRPNELQKRIFSEWTALGEAGNVVAINRSFAQRVYSPQTQKERREFFSATEKDGMPEELRRFTRLTAACRDFSFYDELDKIRCPVLVLGSEGDRIFSADASRVIAEKLGCDLYIYREYGHAFYDEDPGFCERMLRFFTEE